MCVKIVVYDIVAAASTKSDFFSFKRYALIVYGKVVIWLKVIDYIYVNRMVVWV